MKLKVYLAVHNMTSKEFAQKIEIGKTYMSRILNGHEKPGRRLAKDIERETGGEVTVSELLEEKPSNESEN